MVPEIPAANRLNMSHDQLELPKERENILDKSLDLNISTFASSKEDHDSNLFSSSKLQHAISTNFVKKEINEIIYSLISREYVMWNEPGKTRRKIVDEPEEQKAKFSQPIMTHITQHVS